MSTINRTRLAAALLAAITGLAPYGCGGDSSTSVNQVASVSVTPASASLTPGATRQLTATPRNSSGTALAGRTVTWGTSNGAVATVNATGLVTAGTVGTATITANSEGREGTATITVALAPVASVAVTPPTPSIVVGGTVQMTGTPRDAQGSPLAGRTVTWSTSNGTIASVSTGGLVTGEAVGTATITATSEGVAGSTTVTVLAVPVATVSVTPLTASVAAGDTVRLTATPRDALGNALAGRTVTWASSSDAIATVSTSGLVTGVTDGAVTITASSEGQNGTATVTVTGPPVATVEVDPAAATLQVDDTQQLTAIPRDSDGTVLVGRAVTWSSSNALVASVTNTGLVTAHALGTATITATSEGQEGTSVITVTNAPPPPDNTAPLLEDLTLEPDTADVSGGVDTVAITLHVTDATGVQSVTVNLRSPSMTRTLAVAVYEPSAGTRTDGTWLARIVIPTDAEEGNWTVTDVTLRDVNGNIRLLSTTNLQNAGFPTSVYVRR